MSSESKPQKAINFLSLVRQDLEDISSPNSSGSIKHSDSTVVVNRFSEVNIDTPTELSPEDSPAVIGRFEIIEQIGEGGFARVFLANDPNLDREVALKVPKPHVLLSPESVARFEREAKSAAILSHPNIVPVFESGSLGPIQFIASEFCSGPTLRQWFSDNDEKPNPRTTVEIVCRLADALQHAHQRGIIHRDLKPANIILVDGDESAASRLRITDFGLARQLSDDESLTANGAIVGTPAYMSPEQASGTVDVDHRTDIYSLGMILYELLTGKSPYKRKSHMASIAAVINEAVPSIRMANPTVDLDLESVCLKALEKDPDSRYETAHEFGQDLQRWIDGHAVSVRKPSQTETFGRWLKRNPMIAAAILFSVVSLSAGLAFSFVQWKQAQANLNQSIQQRDRAEKNVDELHRTIVSALEVSLDSLEQDSTFSPVQHEVLDYLMTAHKRLIEEEAEQVEITPVTFECYERLARVYRETCRFDQASEICDQADKMLESCRRTEEGRQKFALSAVLIRIQRACNFGDQGDAKNQLRVLQEAEEYYLDAEVATDRKLWLEKGTSLYRVFGYTLQSLRQNELGREAFTKAGEIASEAMELYPEDESVQFEFARTMLDVSHNFRSSNNWHIGLESLQQSEALLIKIAENPETEIDCRYRLAYVRYDIALLLRSKVKDYVSAEEYLFKAIASLKELVKEKPGDYVYSNRLSHAHLRLERIYSDQDMLDEVLNLVPISQEYHRQGMPRRANPRISRSELKRAKIWAYEYDELELAEASFNKAAEVIESSEYFELDDELHVDGLIEAHRQRSMFYDRIGESKKSTDAAGDGYRVAVQRVLMHPGDRNLKAAMSRGTSYAERLAKTKQYGLAKAVLDTLAEAGNESANVQYDLAHIWASHDFNQRNDGEEKKLWEASREKSLQLLSRAVDLGFDDFKRLRNGKYFKDYRHLPTFEACCERIEP